MSELPCSFQCLLGLVCSAGWGGKPESCLRQATAEEAKESGDKLRPSDP